MNFAQTFPFGMTSSQIEQAIQAGFFTEPLVSGKSTHRPFAKKLGKLLEHSQVPLDGSVAVESMSSARIYYTESRREQGLYGGSRRNGGRKPRRPKQNRETIRGAFLH